MPSASMHFDLPDERPEFLAAVRASEALSVLWQIDSRCRSVIKYGNPPEETVRLLEEIRSLIPQNLLEEE